MNKTISKSQTGVLLVAGTLLIAVAVFVLVSPVSFYAANTIELGTNVSLLNEIKAPAGFLLAAGAFITGAIFIRSQVEPALWLATLIYLSYAASRFVSMLIDGLPAPGLVQAAALEGVVGIACLSVLVLRRHPSRRVAQ